MASFWEKLKPNGDCLEWTGNVQPRGYGMVRVGSRTDGSRRMMLAHRRAFELANGPIPEGMQVMHLCNNKLCCNPDHLRLGTNSENTQMAADDGLLPWKRLSAEDVAEIRWLYGIGALCKDISAAFGVSLAHAYNIAVYKARRAC